jgi:anti-sigma-K factor RskA
MSASHDQLAPLASAYALGALDPDERRSFERHAAECDICTAEVHAFSDVVSALATSVPQVAPPFELRERVIAAVHESSVMPPVGAASVTPVSLRPTSSRITNRKSRITNLRSGMIWLPYAALLAVTVGLGGYSLSLRARVADLEVRLADASSRTLLATRAMDDAQRVALQTQSTVDVLTAPDLARIDLAGQPTAPSAQARALWSRQRGMVFTASNLPQLPAGRVYQVWVVTADARISAGLVMPDNSGSTTATFATPPDIAKPVAVAVTLEPAGGVPQPTGAFYLLGRALIPEG